MKPVQKITANFFIGLVCLFAVFAVSACGGGTEVSQQTPLEDSLHMPSGKFYAISDLHFNPYYDSTLVKQLAQSDVTGWESIFKSSKITQYGVYGEDSNFPLLKNAFMAMAATNAHPDFIVITGDFLGHNFQSDFVQYTGITNTDSIDAFIKKTIQFIALELQNSFPNIPIYPVLGNNDDYCGDYMIQPNDAFLPMFAKTWTPFLASIKGENTFSQTVPSGGYYATSLPGFPNHVIIGLNTIFFSPKNSSSCQTPDTVSGQVEMKWLSQTLATCAKKKQKVWFTCHIPPGADVYSSLKNQGNEKKCEEHIKMMWETQYSDAFMALENQYSDIIVGGLAGHTHMDDFRVVSDPAGKRISFFHINPSISPIFSNNPAFQLFTYNPASMSLLNYNTYAFQGLQTAGDNSWKMEYDFDKTYKVTELTGQSLGALWQSINSNATVRGNYLLYYGVGSQAAEPTVWMPYWCGIGKLGQGKFGECACGGK